MNRLYWVAFGLLFLVIGYLSFARLGYTGFWDDEAATALISRNFLETGKFTGWDGKNLMGYRSGGMLDDKLRPLTPPLDSVLCAIAFRVGGMSTVAARVPFVLLSLLGLFMLWKLVREEFPEHPNLALLVLAIAGLSCQYLLIFRTSRYFPLGLMLPVFVYYFYARFHRTLGWGALAGLALSAAALFYAHPLICGCCLVGLAGVLVLCNRATTTRTHLARLAIAAALFLAICLPYAISFRIWVRPDLDTKSTVPFGLNVLRLLRWNIVDLNYFNIFPWTGLVLLAVLIPTVRRVYPSLAGWSRIAAYVAVYIVALSLLSPQDTKDPHPANFRYMVGMIPFVTMLAAGVLYLTTRFWKGIPWVLATAMVTSNALFLLPVAPKGWKEISAQTLGFRWLLPAYVREIHSPYPTVGLSIAETLDKLASPDDTVLIMPEYHILPVHFYTGHKFRFSNQLGETPHWSAATRNSLPAFLFRDREFPKWLVLCQAVPGNLEQAQYLQRVVKVGEQFAQFNYELVGQIAVWGQQIHRPELNWHHFQPTPVTEAGYGILVFQRVGPFAVQVSPAPGQPGAAAPTP